MSSSSPVTELTHTLPPEFSQTATNMTVVYEPREVFNPGNYPDMGEHADPTDPDNDRFPDASDAVVADLANVHFPVQAAFMTEARMDLPVHMSSPTSAPKEDSPTASTPQRHKAIEKPQRTVTRNPDGKFVCSWPGCTEDIKEFGRKCEWSKHMDKHDRPYKCLAEGCEKLPGFTYSGGLLRHEREVHGKHGGPKNSYNCPHFNCKRHTGKGFSRLENLNEHCRRVHSPAGLGDPGVMMQAGDSVGAGDMSDIVSETAVAAVTTGVPRMLGHKRKRESEDLDVRDDIKRLRQENEELRRQVEAQTAQTSLMMQQITSLQTQLSEALASQQQQIHHAQPSPMLSDAGGGGGLMNGTMQPIAPMQQQSPPMSESHSLL